MLSPGYFDYRWSWYRPIFSRGDTVAARCHVDVRRLPVRLTGADGKIHIPYAMHPDMSKVMYTAMRRLQDYSIRYMVNGEKISAHQLPTMNPVARTMVKHLRKRYPHLSQTLLHHWCADEKGALAIFEMWQSMWKQSWKQDQIDGAPWVAAVNILILKLIREAIAELPKEHEAHTDHVLVCVAGGLYDWALRNFLKQHVEGSVEVTRIATYEAMMIPVTPITFLYRQPEDSLLGDDRFVIISYGLEPDIVPRLRQLRASVESKHEAGIIPLLAQDKMGEHMLRRSWARLALWELAEETGQGVWMQWVLNAKKLDQFLAKPEALNESAVKLLESNIEYPIAAWILARRDPKRSKAAMQEKPWLKDDCVLNAFRVFEEDVNVEKIRRKAETVWLDRRYKLAAKGRSSEVDKTLLAAWSAGELVYFQGSEKSLHSGVSLSSNQACLSMDWVDYLVILQSAHTDYATFLQKVFLPAVLSKFEGKDHIFLDSLSASGCLMRGTTKLLLRVGLELKALLKQFYLDADLPQKSFLPISMCMTMMGDWSIAQYKHQILGDFRLATGLLVSQANAGIAHDATIGDVIMRRDKKSGLKALGGVRVESIDMGGGEPASLLFNQGFALTEAALQDYCENISSNAKVKKIALNKKQASSIFSAYRLPSEVLELWVVSFASKDEEGLLFVKVGSPKLNGACTDLYELLDASTASTRLIYTDIISMDVGA